MLTRLVKYQQEIAISLMSLFLISGIMPLKANAYNNSYTGNRYHAYAPKKTIRLFDSQAYTLPSTNGATPKVEPSSGKPGLAKKLVNAKRNSKINNKTFIGGPGQPEMGAFKPASADNMVDLFSGDMSYNIPLLDVGGYPVNIFYNSGITMDQEASWTGLGWNINPGTITRNMRGLPDDFDGTDLVTKTLSMRPDKTWGVGIGGGIEIAGTPIGIGGNLGVSFNNQRGMGMDFGINAHISLSKGGGDEKTTSLTLGVGLNLNSQSGATVTPSIGLSMSESSNKVGNSGSGNLSASISYNSRVGLQSLHLDAEVSKTKTSEKKGMAYSEIAKEMVSVNRTNTASASVMSSDISFAYPSVTPSIRARLSRLSMTASLKVGFASFFLHPNGTLNGYYSQSRIADEDKITTHPAYGVMFYQKANNDENALLDFNRLQDGVFTKKNPAIAIPTYSYDVFSISGEGVGGSFRAYRGDLGYVHDAKVTTRDDAGKIGFDLGIGTLAAHAGVNLEYVYSPASAGSWDVNNLAKNMLTFKESKAAYQAVYFKNPGEKTIPDANFQNAIGGEELVRLKMTNYQTGSPVLMPVLEKFNTSKTYTGDIPLVSNNVIKNRRDKRTQVITCLNAEEASRVGMDKDIKSYDPNVAGVIFGNCSGNGIANIKRNTESAAYTGADKYRKAHHISQIDVLGGDGRKYVYGIPVYNTKQVDATFNINNGNKNNLQSSYTPNVDDTKSNTINKDWYIEKEEIPAYTHSFLLTQLISPNYVDVKGDGITEDDMGDAVKFNYSQFAPVKWRNPISTSGTPTATYSEGLKTNNQDDKAHYTYGEREQWYLYTVESKNMVAKFYLDKERRDGRPVLGDAGTLDVSYNAGAQLLRKISLFSKGDLLRLGNAAKPIKTVYFEYDYSLCPNTPTNNGVALNVTVGNEIKNLNENKGKLTLRSIYFTYNGNERTKKNKYTFHYPSDKNPGYDYTSNDRWGNYKPALDAVGVPNNIGGLPNSDYPYSIQNKAKADKYAAAWIMDSIGLPSGGKIKIDYEADDYAYVQDRRAAAMYQIAGFGNTPFPNATQFVNSTIYDKTFVIGAGITDVEYEYVYAKIPVAINTTLSPTAQLNELKSKYFSSKSDQLLMKLSVKVKPGEGSEIIPFYADIESVGVIPPAAGQPTSDRIFIKVKRLESHTPMVQYCLQFLKNNLPGTAFPGYDNTEGGLKAIVKALAGMFNSLKELFAGVDNNLKNQSMCKWVETDKSFLRLTDPYFVKYGGGLRVKKITISDNWDKMTKQAKATYGQEYKYTKIETINGKAETISSGVASWEPSIGGEENPHREMMTYYNHNKLGPFEYNAIELPLAEMFFPSASVGYSHVEVLPIHRDTVKNAIGKATSDFFTTREFPTKSDYTFLEDRVNGGASFHEDPKILAILRIKAGKHFALSQGFKVDLNDMNGKVRMQESFGANGQLISHTENFYNTIKATDGTYKFNHIFQTLNSPNGVLANSLIGRDIELMTDMRNHNSKTISTNLNINLDMQMIGIFPIVIPPMLSPVFREENDYKSASLLKVVTHFGMLDSMVVINKGSQVNTKNLVYDAETGNVLLTRTNNEHDKPIYNFTYPAHWAYSGMGPAYRNIDVAYNNLSFRNGLLENAAAQGVDFKHFESGDELYVYSPLIYGPTLTSCDIGAYPAFKNPVNRIWAINTNKAGGANRITFMDAQGNPYNATQVTMRIIRSGHRNMLEQMVGAITSLNSPIVNNQLMFNDATGILQTTAATFKDHWRADDAMYRKDTVLRSTPIFIPPNFTVCKGDTIGEYTSCGSFIYSSFNSSSSHFTRTRININNPFWIGAPEDQVSYCGYTPVGSARQSAVAAARQDIELIDIADSTGLSLDKDFSERLLRVRGPLNRCGIWACPPRADTIARWIGFSKTITVADNKVYYVGMGADNQYRFKIDGQIFVEGAANNSESFKAWHIYPVTLTAGTHTIEMEARNYGGPASFGAEIYDNTAPEIIDADHYKASPADIAHSLNAIFSTKDLVGQQFEVGVYTCPLGYALNTSSGNPAQYICESVTSVCRSRFSNKLTNPYVEGVFGNWRADSLYSYYGARKEIDPDKAVDIRVGGTITGYKNFWNFNPDATSYFLKRNYSASREWAWNSTSTQFNRKGYETENKDPLGRFNAGIYGYNGQLPIAVANNARLREIMYDGFEDYDYRTEASCNQVTQDCEISRHAIFKNVVAASLSSQEHHTGRYSLKVAPNTSVLLTANVKNAAAADSGYGFNMYAGNNQCSDTLVTPTGTGYTLVYDNLPPGPSPFLNAQNIYLATSTPLENGTATWSGYLLPTSTGYYDFKTVDVDNHIVVEITDLDNPSNVMQYSDGYPSPFTVRANYRMNKGRPYKIIVYYNNFNNINNPLGGHRCSATLLWRTPEMKNAGLPFDYIPTNQVYKDANSLLADVTTNQQTIYSLDQSQASGNKFNDKFSLLQGAKMVLSAWVKESADCKCVTYTKNNISLSFDGTTAGTFAPTGNIIEGWQRYEVIFDVPANAKNMTVSLKNNGATGNVFFDDVRIHPFNANQKSFVYHSSNLRLMAELDENNYASFYEYDDDGTLTRIKKETERGIKTITETRSALQKPE